MRAAQETQHMLSTAVLLSSTFEADAAVLAVLQRAAQQV